MRHHMFGIVNRKDYLANNTEIMVLYCLCKVYEGAICNFVKASRFLQESHIHQELFSCLYNNCIFTSLMVLVEVLSAHEHSCKERQKQLLQMFCETCKTQPFFKKKVLCSHSYTLQLWKYLHIYIYFTLSQTQLR